MKTQFIEFLKKNRCLTAFKKGLTFTTFDKFLDRADPENYISLAFIWPDEKMDYWSQLDKKWRKQIQ